MIYPSTSPEAGTEPNQPKDSTTNPDVEQGKLNESKLDLFKSKVMADAHNFLTTNRTNSRAAVPSTPNSPLPAIAQDLTDQKQSTATATTQTPPGAASDSQDAGCEKLVHG